MELIEHTEHWVKGEVFQGRIMMAIGMALLFAFIAILRSDHELLKGTTIPMGLMIVVLLGYGSMQVFSRPAHVAKVTELMKESPEKAIDQEYNKAIKDNKAYSTLKPIWAVLIVVAVVLYYVFSTHYLKGLSLGLIGLFLTLLLVDSVLHYRLTIYLEAIKTFLPN